MKHLHKHNFAIVDVETTGGSPTGDRVIEIGILRIEKGEVMKTFHSLINPRSSISPWIERITGISTDMVRGAPYFEDIAEEIQELLEDAIFVAHNARFDYGFIKNELKRTGSAWNAKSLCTVRLSRALYPRHKKHDLSSIISRFSLSCESRHRAYDDAKVLYDFLRVIDREHGESAQNAIDALLKGHTLPQFLDAKTIALLPDGPGVYTFYGEEGETLYIGKSKNVRQRVLSHFSNDHATTKEMNLCQETHRVEAEETAGELSALLLESARIKKERPLYNRVLRKAKALVIAKKKKRGNYLGVELVRTGAIEPREARNILGVFRSVSQAKAFLSTAAKEHSLCPKILGLENGRGACFYSHIGKCDGACSGKNNHEEFNKRVLKAFKRRRLRAWPFGSPIMITERKNDEESHSFILDNWCLIRDVKVFEDSVEENSYTPYFDYDSYKIFLSHLRNPENRKRIKRLTREERAFLEEDEKTIYVD